MNGQNRKFYKYDYTDNITNSGRGEISLRYVSPNPSQPNKSLSNIFLNQSNIGDLSKLSDSSVASPSQYRG